MKSIKYIIKRIIIGVGIAIALMLIKGNLLIGVSAEELITRQPISIGILADNSYNEYPIISNTGWGGHDVWSPGTQSNDWSGSARLNYNYTGGDYCTQTQNYGTLSGIFYNASSSLNSGSVVKFLYTTTSSEFTCSTNLSGNKGTFSCTGVDFTKNFTLLIYNASPGAYGVVKQLGYTCEASIGSQIENDNQNTQNIINNNNTNTQTIINNNNQNTQTIINNQNENTEKEIESQKVCSSIYIDKSSGVTTGLLASDGSINSSYTDYTISDYVSINENSNIIVVDTSEAQRRYCFYNGNKTLISCNNSMTNITIPSGSRFVRFTIRVSTNIPTFNITTCQNGNQAIADGQQDLNNSLNDDSGVSDTDIDNLFGELEESDTPISDLLLMPLTLLNAYLDGFNSSCQSINIGRLYGTDIIFPCIDIESYIGSSLWGLIDALVSLFMIFNIGQLIITAFDGITSLNDDFQVLYGGRHVASPSSRVERNSDLY